MSIAFDAISTGGASTDSLTVSHTTSTTDSRVLIVTLLASAGDVITGITYGGDALTQLTKLAVSDAGEYYMYYRIAPKTGANDVVISASSSNFIRSINATYTGIKQTGFPDASGTATATSTSVSKTLTSVANGCWAISGCVRYTSGAPAAGTGVYSRGTSVSHSFGDSNADIIPAGNYSMTWTIDPSQLVYMIMATMEPSTPPSNFMIMF